MKIFGHPLHIMLIHFPSALFPMDLGCSLIRYFTGNASFTAASFYAMCGGVILGWLAIIAGGVDLLQVLNKKPGAVKTMLYHAAINTTVVMIYTVLAGLQYKAYPALIADGVGMLFLKAATVNFMILGNFLGGNLVLKHKIAVEEKEI